VNAPADITIDEPGLFSLRILLPFLLVSLIWGSTWFVIADQLNVVPPAWSVCYRFSVAAIGMFVLAIITRTPVKLEFAGQLWAILLGFMQFALNFNFVYTAEHYVTSGLVAVIFALLIMPNAILGKLWLGRSVAPSFWLGSAIAVGGVALLLLREYRIAPVGGSAVLAGIGLTLCGVMSASISNVIQASPKLSRYPVITILAWAMLWGALANAVFASITSGPPVIEIRGAYIAGVLYLGLIGSVVTFPLYFGLIRQIGPGKAAYSSVLIPVIAMALSTLFEHYRWSMLAASGAGLAMLGLLIAMQARKTEARIITK
jgi:drug/metabolite transporter (DMT)-like permease